MAELSKQPYKGSRDFYPEDLRIRNYIFNTWRQVVEGYGYEEYDAPLLEPTELYKAKTGDEIVNEQMYTFEDRGRRQVSIRPEMTPTVARMVAAQRQELGYPLRWYSIPVNWRYERPQRGRLREFYQLNVDIFGVGTIDAELELISISYDIMKRFGADSDDFSIKINSRQLVNLIMAEYLQLDVTPAHQMMKLLDRKDKIDKNTLISEAEQIFPVSFKDEGVQKLTKLIEAKSMADLPQSLLDSDPIKQIQILFTLLKENNVKNAVFDVALMRGFDYYTDIVFEVFDTHPDNNRSIFGGGRYDGLVGLFGVEPVPTVGFAIGDVGMRDFLETHKLLKKPGTETDIYIIVVGELLREAQGVANLLRQQGVNVAIDLTKRKTEKQIKAAVKKGINYALFVGEQELASEKFTLKDLKKGSESNLSLHEIANLIQEN